MLQNSNLLPNDVATMRLIDGTEIIGQYMGKEGNFHSIKNIMKIIIDEDNNVKTEIFMAGISNMPVNVNSDHITILCKTHETMCKSYLNLLGETK